MPFDFASLKSAARRVVQTTLGVQAFYQDASLGAPIETRARWHNRIDRFGDDQRQGYAEVIEGIERIILIPEVWIDGANTNTLFVPQRTGTLTFPGYDGISFTLDTREPRDGPLEQAWLVTRR